MLEIIIAAVAAIAMARKGRGRRRAYLRGQIDHNQLLGTLAGVTAIASGLSSGEVLVRRAWLSSIVCSYSVQNWTKGATVGPLIIGVSHNDYTASEIDAWMETTNSWDQGDKIQQEIGRRKIRKIGTLVSADATDEARRMNDGKPVRTKCGWQLEVGDTVKFWMYNDGTTAFATTDPRVSCQGHANLWPN